MGFLLSGWIRAGCGYIKNPFHDETDLIEQAKRALLLFSTQ